MDKVMGVAADAAAPSPSGSSPVPGLDAPHSVTNAQRQPIDDLVNRFAEALREKLHAAEAKYGWQNAWLRDDWRDDLIAHLRRHVEKGDPRDVAAYCAFAWHHGWSVAPAQEGTPNADEQVREAARHLAEYADGLDVAADCERRIEAAYAPEDTRWDAGERGDAKLNRMVRNMLDARTNARRIEQDAHAIRTVLAALASVDGRRMAGTRSGSGRSPNSAARSEAEGDAHV